MSKNRLQFTPEFKAEMVALCLAGDRIARQLAQDPGICASVVQRLVQQIEGESTRRFWRPDGGGA